MFITLSVILGVDEIGFLPQHSTLTDALGGPIQLAISAKLRYLHDQAAIYLIYQVN